MFPSVEPFARGMLEVGDGNELYWETSGNPAGKSAVHLNGGPGSAIKSGYRRRFDPDRYLIVGFDQRGCGRSRPLATDNLDVLPSNTTQAVIADLEALRSHLGIDRWLLSGVSWGTTLAVAYAQQYPERVSGMLLAAVALTTPLTTSSGSPRASASSFPRHGTSSRERQAGRVVSNWSMPTTSYLPGLTRPFAPKQLSTGQPGRTRTSAWLPTGSRRQPRPTRPVGK